MDSRGLARFLMIPAYVVGYLAAFSTFFFVWFLGALRGLIWSAEGEVVGLSSAALAGGTLFIALSCAGYAAEIVYPVAQLRFENFAPGAQPAFTSLTPSAWLYHFCQVGASVMVTATSPAALGSGVLPRWLALVSVLMLAGSVSVSAPRRRPLAARVIAQPVIRYACAC